MARVTVEDCLDREENRFALVVLAATRTRQIMKGAKVQIEGARYRNKPAVMALREIAAGRVHYDRASHEAVEQFIVDQKRRFG